MEAFLKNAPKVELHAHLNGSLKLSSVKELITSLYGENVPEDLQHIKEILQDSTNLENVFKKFQFMHDLSSTKAGLEMLTMFVIRDFSKDNVVYLELRTTAKDTPDMSRREYIKTVVEAINKSAVLYPKIIVKLLVSFNRAEPVRFAEQSLDAILSLDDLYAKSIVGIDLSGNPYCGDFNDFKFVLEIARKNGLKLALHCGECEERKAEIADMLDFGMDRCGHGTFLSNEQFQQLAQRRIALECCLTSNVLCKTVENYKSHHAGPLIKNNKNAVVLCTDDAGIFDTTLTKEFLLAIKHLGIAAQEFFRLTLNAVEHSFTDKITKQKLHKQVLTYFCKGSM